jgi:hypothetical protein
MSIETDGQIPQQTFWVYKRGQLVLIFNSNAGVFVPTRGPLHPDAEQDGVTDPCPFASGQYLSVEWEPRIRVLQQRGQDLVDFIELLEDRRYEVDLDPPSMRTRPFRSL